MALGFNIEFRIYETKNNSGKNLKVDTALIFIIIFILLKKYSSLIHLHESFPSFYTPPRSPIPPLSPRCIHLCFLFRKEQASKIGKPNRTKQYAIRQGINPHIVLRLERQSNSSKNVLR